MEGFTEMLGEMPWWLKLLGIVASTIFAQRGITLATARRKEAAKAKQEEAAAKSVDVDAEVKLGEGWKALHDATIAASDKRFDSLHAEMTEMRRDLRRLRSHVLRVHFENTWLKARVAELEAAAHLPSKPMPVFDVDEILGLERETGG